MNILIYSRPKAVESIAEQTITILTEQLQQLGLHVETTHSLNLPRLILNSYQAVHLVIENLPLTPNEALHLGICKALGKSTILSILNSDRYENTTLLNFVKPDALSVSQTNHFKYYRDFTCHKFVFQAFPKSESTFKKSYFKHQAYLVPIQEKLEEALLFQGPGNLFFDGRKLLQKRTSLQLRKKWNDLVVAGKISAHSHLILSDTKLTEILSEESVAVVLADPSISPVEFTQWLGRTMNKNNLIILNEYQATGFSGHWTSGLNCLVTPIENWLSVGSTELTAREFFCSGFKATELFEPTVNDLSRLYSKLQHQKTSLLTSGSVKL